MRFVCNAATDPSRRFMYWADDNWEFIHDVEILALYLDVF